MRALITTIIGTIAPAIRAASRKCLIKGDLKMSLAKHFNFADHISYEDMAGDFNLFLSQFST